MALTNTTTLPKFRRLARALGLPNPYVLGHLEMLWQFAHHQRKHVFDDIDIELIVEWQGAEGDFLHSAIEFGWLDWCGDGKVEIHDYWTNAPRFMKELKRKRDYAAEKRVAQSSAKDRKVAQDSAEVAQSSASGRTTAQSEALDLDLDLDLDLEIKKETTLYDCAPQNPTPAHKIRKPSTKSETMTTFSTGFLAVWKSYPHYGGRSSKAKSWDKWRAMRLDSVAGLPELILSWVEHLKKSVDWQKQDGQFVPALQVWLGNKVWTNGEPPASEKKELACEWETE